jgi:hypothetical protein
MPRRRPCRICRHWFTPDPRNAPRQKVCSGECCQRERHRLSCRLWRERHPDYDREERLRRRLRPLEGEVRREVARDAVGLEVFVVLEETGKDLRNWARDAVIAQWIGRRGVGARVPPPTSRDAIARSPRAP